ncbi:methyltransferase-like protein 27 isoform X2 [Mytilus galloprovincialis]|uniref:methyltransferase-like protein 27 isoform X2 n=1 Tax=Mytilus galloprovincialis TaxID=29158 RepID=UPI003F7B798A
MADHFNERLKEILVGKVTSDTAVKIYDEWGQNGYDQSVSAQAYIGPEVTAKTIASLYDKSERDTIQLLDIGAGTGLVGEQLRKFGFSKIDALEPAGGMLASARNKNLYRNYHNHYLKKDTLIDANGLYDCVCTCGCLAPGHIPVDSLHDFLRFTKKGGNIVLTMKQLYHDVPGYSESMRSLLKDFENSGKWEKKLESQFPNYFEDALGVTYVFKLL